MYTILIVDDEEPVLESYSFIIEHSDMDFQLAGKARSGTEAVSKIYQLKPDVVFMDISMPGMDGIEVITQVHSFFPNMLFVLSTAYERFDLAQKAIPLGIFDYLVKPVSKKTLISTLSNLQDVLLKRASNSKENEEKRNTFFSKAIWNPISDDDWQAYKELFKFSHSQFAAVLIQCNPQFYSEITKSLTFRYNLYDGKYLSFLLLLFPKENVLEGTLFADIEKTIRNAIPENEEAFISSGNFEDGKNIYISCQQALKNITGQKDSILKKEQLFISQIRKNIQSCTDTEQNFSQFCTFWNFIFSFYDFPTALSKMTGFFYLLSDDLFHNYSTAENENPIIDFAFEIMSLKNIREWEEWSKQAFFSICSTYHNTRNENLPQQLLKAIQIINENYKSQIQLSSLASEIGISEAYLSRLFSEYIHKSFIDYLTELRISKAQELLLSKKISIKEVSFEVGYQDPNYFSKIFKKIMGCSPKDFGDSN